MKFGLLAAVLLGAVLSGLAQEPAKESLTPLETLRLENITLQSQLARALAEKADCYAALGPAQAQRNSEAIQKQAAALKAQIEAAHPGFTFDVATGKLTPKLEPKKDGGL